MEPESPSTPPGNPAPRATHDFQLEESILRALENPCLSAPAELGTALARATLTRRVILYSREAGEWRPLAASSAEATFLSCGDLLYSGELEKLDSQESSGWTFLDSENDAWRAGIALRRPPTFHGGVLLEGTGSRPPEAQLAETADAVRMSILVATAAAIEQLKARCTTPKEEAGPTPGPGMPYRPTPGPLQARPPLLEFPLHGSPGRSTTAEVFAMFPEIVGGSTLMAGILQSVICAAKSDIPVLIEGESGTGKELIARAIHRASRRGKRPFVCENCGAVPENLVESEFFGHERGAFTGAEHQRPGVFERASGGTVFLDEVGEMDRPLQRKLLRVLQEREIRRIGGQATIPVDFRLVSATNRVLEEMVAGGRFREDLYYRLQVTTIHMPALRERPEDIPLLLEHFMRLFAEETGKEPIQLTQAAIDALTSYRWPGNVRELRNEVWRHACSEQSRVGVENLSRGIIQSLRAANGAAAFLPRPLQEFERSTIAPMLVEALRRANGNRSEAARILGVTRSVLYRRLQKYNLVDPHPPDRRPAGQE